ncbi:exportin-4 [Achlya hypogyna]|uniref:Exportin-4 n=1 Tax=Achlya hypogyna TaxID=1202772 RepID=A0A1V9YEG8_ACHHY|nr:exportin-4 [Achlya hypogyna]
MEVVERACAAFAASTSAVERQAAEAVLQQFKASPNARADSIHLLTHSAVPLAQFHALTTIRELGLLDRVSTAERSETIHFLLQHACTAYTRLPPFVSSPLLVTTAVLMKRNWLALPAPERHQLLTNIAGLYQSDVPQGDLIATKLLLAFVTEMTGGSDKKASAMGQPLAFHQACRHALEADGLRDILALALSLLQRPFAPDALHHAYLLCVEVLAWHEVPSDGPSSCLVVLPNDAWKTLLLQPDVLLGAMQQSYVTHAADATLRHTIRQLVLQLASLSGGLFASGAEHLAYLQAFFGPALRLLETHLSDAAKEAEVIDLCQLTLRVCANWGCLKTTEMAAALIDASTRLSCTLLQLAITDAAATTTATDLWQMEGLDVLMDAWSIVIRQVGETHPSLHDATPAVVALYLQLRLRMCGLDADEDELDDMEEQVTKSVEEQVELVSALARLQPTQTLTLLRTLLTDAVAERARYPRPDVADAAYSQLLERLHFLVLFAGIVLADDCRGETPAMPACYAGVAPLVADVLTLLLQLTMDETARVEQAPESPALSPFLSEQLLHTFTRLGMTYYCQSPEALPPALSAAFPAASVVHVLLSTATVYLTAWPAQPAVVAHVLQSLLACPATTAAAHMLQHPQFEVLVRAAFDPSAPLLRRLPAASRGGLVEALVRILVVAPSSAASLRPLVAPWADSLQGLAAATKRSPAHEEQAALLLELLAGVARATESRTHGYVAPVVLPFFPAVVQVLDAYHDVAVVVALALKFACDLVEANLAYVEATDAMAVYEGCHALIRAYCQHNQGAASHAANAEEESFEDVLMLLTLLSHLVAKDVIDFADTTVASATVVADVVFAGLHQVVPLMTAALLQYPRLSLQYFTLVAYLVDVYPEKLLHLPPTLLEMLLQSLVVGMQHTAPEIVRYSFQAVAELASYHHKHPQPSAAPFVAFVKVIFRMVVFESCANAVVDGCAIALYPLLLLLRDQFFQIATDFCSTNEMPPELRDQVMAAFSGLSQHVVEGSSVAATRKLRAQFKTQLYAFVAHVRGYIQMK